MVERDSILGGRHHSLGVRDYRCRDVSRLVLVGWEQSSPRMIADHYGNNTVTIVCTRQYLTA
jgi:hypothetical protein